MGFDYRDLSGLFHLGLIDYTRELQEHAFELEREVIRLNKQLSKSGNKYYQRDAAKWGEEWQQKCIEVGELRRQIIEQAAEKDTEINRLQHEIDWLNEQLEDYQAAETPKTQKKRDSASGQFVADIPKKQKMKMAYDMHRQGYTDAQIARKLDVTTSTVKNYISTHSAELNRKWLAQQQQSQYQDSDVICYG